METTNTNTTSTRVQFNLPAFDEPTEYTYTQGESPAVHYAWTKNTRIARITGKEGKSLFTVNMDCGITLANKFDNRSEAAEAAFNFYKDNFYLDFINA